MLTYVSVYATIALLLMWMGFFMLSSLPLLVLEHDTPLDARFIRGLFDVYYKAVMAAAAAGLIAHGLAHRPGTALGMAIVGGLAWGSRRVILGRMDALRATMTPADTQAIRQFRRLHISGMVLNVVQLVTICVGMVFVL